MANMLNVFDRLIEGGNLHQLDQIELPSRPPRQVAIPDAYRHGPVGSWLMNDPQLRGHIWLHQGEAMDAAAAGHNVVIATGTASGKSLAFQAITFRTLQQEADSSAVIFYPLKALVRDQLKSWRRAADLAGIPRDNVVLLDGDVPRAKRAPALEHARVVLMTPDVCHAWLLSEVSNPLHKAFLCRLSIVVIDEAHTLEGVFGTNFAYFFRRLRAARSLSGLRPRLRSLQVVAATATIRDPSAHLESLTGLPFQSVDEALNGAPSHGGSIVHAWPDAGLPKGLVECVRSLVVDSTRGSLIAFVDSRQGTERVAADIDLSALVKSYRSGFEPQDRADIEASLKNGQLRGVVSTSALELGIDVPHFTVGINAGIPYSRKSFRQRLGRVGRQTRGVFAILAEPNAFHRFGNTLADYYEASVEPSYLYLRNRFLQYAHARCLSDELEMFRQTGRKTLPSTVDWPEGFTEIFGFVDPAGPSARPREFDQVAALAGDKPQFGFPLRKAPEEVFGVVSGRGTMVSMDSRLEELSLQQAIREAFPGAIFLHRAKGRRVGDWRNTTFERTIRVDKTTSPIYPKPVIRTFVNVGTGGRGILGGNIRRGSGGFLAECHLQINERVEGYVEGGIRRMYADLREAKPWMTPKTRDFRTTGVVICVNEAWFRRKGVKQALASTLRELMQRQYSIAPQDMDSAASNIAFVEGGIRRQNADTIVLFDTTHGSLRLTEPAYCEFDRLIVQLERSVALSGSDNGEPVASIVTDLRRWFEALGDATIRGSGSQPVSGSDGWLHVYGAGSIVARRDQKNVLRDIEIRGHEIMETDDGEMLVYRYRAGRVKGLIPADKVEPVGDDWKLVQWNPETDETRETEDEDEEEVGGNSLNLGM